MSILKNHFWTKAIVAAGAVLALGGTTVVSAAKGTWTVTEETVSAGGGWSSYGSSNTKKTNSNYASFNGDVMPNSFGYNIRLINSNASGRSSYVGLYKDSTTRASDNSGKLNYKYYADIRSKGYEINSSRVKSHFSSDYK